MNWRGKRQTIREGYTLEGKDHNVFLPTARASVEILRGYDENLWTVLGGATSEREESKSGFRPSLGVDLDFTHGRGSSSQHLDTDDQYILFQSQRFRGPGTVRHAYDLDSGSLALRGGGWFKNLVGIEGLLGVNATWFDLEVKTPEWRQSKQFDEIGCLVGGQLSVRPLDWLRFNARAAVVIESPVDMLELNAEFTPIAGLGLLAGWQWWSYEHEHDDSLPDVIIHESDLDFQISGPVIGLQLRF